MIWDFAGQLEYTTNHQVCLFRREIIAQYFLSSKNVIYAFVVDVSVQLEKQKEQVAHWFRCLQSKFQGIKEIPIILIGNKIDLLEKQSQQKQTTIDYFDSLKKSYSLEYILVSAKKLQNVREFLEILKEKCLSFFSDEEYFNIPHIYKKAGDYLKEVTQKLIGT